MFYAILLDRGHQGVVHLFLVSANIRGTNIRWDHCVRCLCAREGLRKRARVGSLSNECFCALLRESFKPLRVTAYNTHLCSSCKQLLRHHASSVSRRTRNNVHLFLLAGWIAASPCVDAGPTYEDSSCLGQI